MNQSVPLTRWEGEPVEHWRAQWRIPQLHSFERTPSTNDVLRDAATGGAPAGTVAIAELQTRGRGRLGRVWAAASGKGLLLSVLLRPAAGGNADAAGVLPLRVGLAIAEALVALTGRAPGLKWPNDVQLDGLKVAGILCEANTDFIVAGLGVNVTQTEADFAPELRDQATSLLLATYAPPSRAAVAGAILSRLEPLFEAPHRPLSEAELARFAELDVLHGRRINVDDVPAGTAAGVTSLGALQVERDGERRLIHAGTVRSTG